jgi:Protein of unknown function (DUF1569)
VDPHLKRLQYEIRTIAESLSSEELNWHPAGKWSAKEILEHLYLTYTGTTKGFTRVLASGAMSRHPTFKQRIAAMMVVQVGYFPNGVESPAVARPRGTLSEQVMVEIGSKIGEMDAILASCASKFGEHAKVLEHPFLGPFSVAQWRKFHLRHGRHHLKQIQQLRRSMRA